VGRQATRDFIRSRLDLFTTRGAGGVVLVTYSALLSRGFEEARGDADEAMGGRNTFIDRHGWVVDGAAGVGPSEAERWIVRWQVRGAGAGEPLAGGQGALARV
jgi:hypothetical protein